VGFADDQLRRMTGSKGRGKKGNVRRSKKDLDTT
jgi:hypothetical protein